MSSSPKALLVAVVTALSLPVFTACTQSPTREAAGEYIDDATITTRVKVALAQDPDVKATEVNVETFRGVVQLSGFVDNQAAARKAAEVAKKVPGVKSVKNDIRTKPSS